MPAWITIYLRDARPVPGAASIQREMTLPDWSTLGEEHDLEEDEVDAFMAALTWSDDPFELRHGAGRPAQFHVWRDPDRVREEIADLDEIAGAPALPAAVRAHMANVRTIVAIELGWSQLGTMFESVVFEVAYWLAETRGGVIRGSNNAWFDHATHRFDPIT